ncbi:hypothetical protein ABUK73_00995 [Agrobacterium sp. BA1120]|uniref:hypothetical protein n=1 Tax=Agrobacterium sp. BA1120 TaxID=3228927 RepID=UPI00336A1C25
MKFRTLSLIVGLVALAGCQTTQPNSPEALKKAEYDRLLLASTVANCKLIMLINADRVAAKKQPSRDNKCASILRNNKLGGGLHAASFVPDIGINGIPIPLGSLVRLAVTMERKQRQEKAFEAKLPSWAVGENTEYVYRFLLAQDFKPEEIERVKSTSEFSSAVNEAGPTIRFMKANPDVVKLAQK